MLKQVSSLNYLRTFSIAAEYLSFKGAASILNISPTAVSHQVKALEEQLRVPLFIRHTRAISLTLQGEKLARACQQSFSQLSHCIEQISQDKNEINISCCNSFAALWLTPRSSEISELLPQSPLKVCASDTLVDLSREMHIDIALRYGEQTGDQNDEFICQEYIGLYKSPNLQTSSKPNLYVTQWPENGLLANLDWQNMLDGKDFNINTFEQEYFVLQAIITGQGYGLLSNVLAQSAIKQGWIEQDFSIAPMKGYSYWLRKNVGREHNHLLARFTAWLKDRMSEV